jgi:hypothetical protein
MGMEIESLLVRQMPEEQMRAEEVNRIYTISMFCKMSWPLSDSKENIDR